jgi:hypothetical protein
MTELERLQAELAEAKAELADLHKCWTNVFMSANSGLESASVMKDLEDRGRYVAYGSVMHHMKGCAHFVAEMKRSRKRASIGNGLPH